MTQNTSLANFALTQEQAFSINPEKDNAIIQAGKFTFATAITTGSFALAVAETALSAIAQIALLPLWIISREGYSQIGKHTSDSAATMVLAARRTFGMDSPKISEEDTAKVGLGQKLKDVAEEIGTLLRSGKDTILAKGKEHKRAVIGVALTTSLAALYFFYPEGLVTEIQNGFWDVCASTKETASWSFEKLSDTLSYTGTKIGKGVTYLYNAGASLLPTEASNHNGEVALVFESNLPLLIELCQEEGMATSGQYYGTAITTGGVGSMLTWLLNRGN